VRAVNLIPSDARRSGTAGRLPSAPSYALLGLLAVAVAFMTLYVLAGNTVSDRKAKLASINAELARDQARIATLTRYQQFEQLAKARTETVREIASSRFDWYSALSDLSKVVPADTSLQTLAASVAPGEGGSAGPAGASSSSLRSDIAAPALELSGCTKTQDDVARLMSRLRLIDGVTRVTLGDSQKQGSAQGGAAVSSAGAGSAAGSTGCGAGAPTFDLVVFFTPLPGATAAAAGSTGTAGASSSPATPAGAASTANGAASTASSAATASGSTSSSASSVPTSSGGSR
jgi:Tfp pilus assembly protein PilN